MSARRGFDAPKELFQVGLMNGRKVLIPAGPWVDEFMVPYKTGAVLEVQIWQDRSPEQHSLYWVVLGLCVKNSESKYGRTTDLHNALKVALGYRREIKRLNVGPVSSFLMATGIALNRARMVLENATGNPLVRLLLPLINQAFDSTEKAGAASSETIILPGSTAFDKMDQAEFSVFFEGAMNQLRQAGYPVDDYLEEAKKLTREREVRQTPMRYGDSNNGPGKMPPQGDRGIEETTGEETAA